MPERAYEIPTLTPGRLAILPRPRGGDWLDADVAAWARFGIGTVVSMLTADKETDLGLVNESHECELAGISFVSLPVPDHEVPTSADDFATLGRKMGTGPF